MHTLYRHFSASGKLLYVGRTIDPPRRLRQHGDKIWWQEVTRTTYEHGYESVEAVLTAETKAIKSEHPIWNKVGNDSPGDPNSDKPKEKSMPKPLPNSPEGTLTSGMVVALRLKPGTAPLRSYVGEVQATDEHGLRLTLVDWNVGMFNSYDFFVPWENIEVSYVAVPGVHKLPEGELDRWQERLSGKWDRSENPTQDDVMKEGEE